MSSSADFDKEMGKGWKSGLENIFGNNLSSFLLECKVYDKKGDEVSDVDAIISFRDPISTLNDLFPKAKRQFRPQLQPTDKKDKGTMFLAAIKRWMTSHIRKKIQSFIDFYDNLLNPNQAESDIQRKTLGKQLQAAIECPKTKLLFVFDGHDIVDVEREMRRQLYEKYKSHETKIRDREVYCVWCDSTTLVRWGSDMEAKEKLKTKKRIETTKKRIEKIKKRNRTINRKKITIKS